MVCESNEDLRWSSASAIFENSVLLQLMRVYTPTVSYLKTDPYILLLNPILFSNSSLTQMSHQQDHNSHGRVLPSSQALSTHHSRDRQSPSSLDGLYRTKPDDELVRRLRCRARNSSEIRAFLRNYSQCKNRSSNRLFESMLSYSLFESPRLFWPLSLITPTTSGTEGPEAQTFSSDLETLRPALRMGNRESVRFW